MPPHLPGAGVEAVTVIPSESEGSCRVRSGSLAFAREDSQGPTITTFPSDGTPFGLSRNRRYGPGGARLALVGACARSVVAPARW